MVSRSVFVFFLIHLAVVAVKAQDDFDLQIADSLYHLDKLDDAYHAYEQVFTNAGGDKRLEGLTGMIKTAIVKADLPLADSLVVKGDALLLEDNISRRKRNKFFLTKGEFYRKASRFEEAMTLHKTVLRDASKTDKLPLQKADACYYVALTFEQLTRYDSSLVYMENAFDIYKTNLKPSDPKFGSIYNALGVCYHRLNKLEKAKSFYLQALSYAEKYSGEASSDLAMCLSNLSNIYRGEEDYERAIDYANQSLNIYQKLGDSYGISSAYYSLGVYNFYLGDYGLAKDYLKACVEIRERVYPANHYLLIGPYEVLGIVYEASDNLRKTLTYLEKVRPIIRSNYGSGSVIEGFNYENTAISFLSTGQLDSAIHYIQLANAILPQNFPPDSRELAGHYFSYSLVLFEAGKYKEAQKMLERSSSIMVNNQLGLKEDYAENLALGGRLAFELGNNEEAEALFHKALAMVKLKDGSFKMIPQTLQVLNKYGAYLWDRYQKTGYDVDLVAFRAFSADYLSVSSLFRQQFLDPYTKSALIKDNAVVFKRNMSAFAELYSQGGERTYLDELFSLSERLRAVRLRDLQDVKAKSLAGYPDTLLQREETLKNRIGKLEEGLLTFGESDSLLQELVTQKEALRDFLEEIRQKYPRLYALRFDQDIIDIAMVQQKLAPGQIVVEYLRDDSSYFAIGIQKNKAALYQLGAADKIDIRVREWINLVKNPGKEERIHQLSSLLYTQLLAPVLEASRGRNILIVPTGPLFYLSFEALKKDGTYLIYDYNISYTLSLDLQFNSFFKNRSKGIISIAPGFEERMKNEFSAAKDSLNDEDQAYLRTVRQPWSLKLAKSLSGNKSLTGLEANEKRVKEKIQSGNVLYFGTHAISDEEDPVRSHLVLARNPGESEEDGLLHAYELFGIPVTAELAVLNACESGLGSIQEGEGMISLAYSLHFAGCPSTVMSLWKVDEKTSTTITEDYFSFLKDGLSKSDALRKAKLQYLDQADGSLQHPFFWAGMVLLGQDDPIEVKSWLPPRYWFFLLIILLSVAWMFFKRKKRP